MGLKGGRTGQMAGLSAVPRLRGVPAARSADAPGERDRGSRRARQGSARFLTVRHVESGTQATRKSDRIVVSPEVHEEQMRRLREHVAVQRRH